MTRDELIDNARRHVRDITTRHGGENAEFARILLRTESVEDGLLRLAETVAHDRRPQLAREVAAVASGCAQEVITWADLDATEDTR